MRLLAISTLLALAGCNATLPHQQAQPSAKDDPSWPCFAGIPSRPELSALTTKIPLGNPDDATIEMLSSSEVPSDEEKKALSVWAKYRSECAQAGRDFRARHAPPGWPEAFDRGVTGVTHAIAALYAGGTYGEFNKERQRLGSRTTSELNAAERGAQQAEAARRSAAQSSALQNLQMMQLMQSMQPKPPTIPAPSPTVTCNSYRYGANTQTTCQ